LPAQSKAKATNDIEWINKVDHPTRKNMMMIEEVDLPSGLIK